METEIKICMQQHFISVNVGACHLWFASLTKYYAVNHNTNGGITEESRESISQDDGAEVVSEATVCLCSSHSLCTEYQLQHIHICLTISTGSSLKLISC